MNAKQQNIHFLSLLICPDLSFIAITAGKITAFVTNF
jgi:hypothetical protein